MATLIPIHTTSAPTKAVTTMVAVISCTRTTRRTGLRMSHRTRTMATARTILMVGTHTEVPTAINDVQVVGATILNEVACSAFVSQQEIVR
jgi:hypothetical protein